MTLLPCPRCRRHVLVDDHACPFCGTARWSRAAILAGALALPACGGSTKPAAPPALVSNTVEESPPPPGATATITGIVTNTRTNGPLVSGYVILVGPDGMQHRALTDETGRYELTGLAAGEYRLSSPPDGGRRRPEDEYAAGDRITVRPGETVEHDLATWKMDPRAKMPYGAPPARRRVV